MPKIKILGKHLSAQELKAAMDLTIEAGCAPADIEVVESVADAAPGCEDDVLLVVTTPAVCGDPALETELEKLQNGGRRAVSIWSEGESVELPEAAKKYAYSIVPWDPKKLSAVLADDDVTCFENNSGDPLPQVPMEHNLCVEDPKKTK